ncbi:MAG: methylated-DNA--protein-cysteine methyltransferase [Acidimicrobiales bacterium]|jgi:methylated-DNA-[protein]-cysteine S-methyltransferase|nr:methylated-DNA--protein-cysteine methyltransferase [Acidimicrobiales bacterium]
MIHISDHDHSPIGRLRFAVEDGQLLALQPARTWRGPTGAASASSGDDAAISTAVSTALDRYFAGDVDALDGIDVAYRGTRFQNAAWQAMRDIEPGSTTSYADLARQVGSPRAVRAIGTACGSNPVFLVVPCHRVLRTDGSLGGYGGGLDMKRWLLDHERTNRCSGRPTG